MHQDLVEKIHFKRADRASGLVLPETETRPTNDIHQSRAVYPH